MSLRDWEIRLLRGEYSQLPQFVANANNQPLAPLGPLPPFGQPAGLSWQADLGANYESRRASRQARLLGEGGMQNEWQLERSAWPQGLEVTYEMLRDFYGSPVPWEEILRR